MAAGCLRYLGLFQVKDAQRGLPESVFGCGQDAFRQIVMEVEAKCCRTHCSLTPVGRSIDLVSHCHSVRGSNQLH